MLDKHLLCVLSGGFLSKVLLTAMSLCKWSVESRILELIALLMSLEIRAGRSSDSLGTPDAKKCQKNKNLFCIPHNRVRSHNSLKKWPKQMQCSVFISVICGLSYYILFWNPSKYTLLWGFYNRLNDEKVGGGQMTCLT